jgi:hypothetical protein
MLQVFNSGKPCGWLGQTPAGFWFHYISNNPQQNWVSLLMPPSTNFYQQAELFPVFAQHLPSKGTDLPPLEYLHQHNGEHLGALSFANPDNPVVKPPLRFVPEELQPSPGQRMLVSAQPRKPFADTLVYHRSIWPLVQTLHALKTQADPNNRLHALRWTLQAQLSDNLVWHPRPDMDSYQQHMLGLEQVHFVLNLSIEQYAALNTNPNRHFQVLQEVVRTYCKNFAAEIQLLEHLLPLLRSGQITAHITYVAGKDTGQNAKPTVQGMQYLPSAA